MASLSRIEEFLVAEVDAAAKESEKEECGVTVVRPISYIDK